VLDQLIAGDNDLGAFIPELVTLRQRWVTEKGRRVNTLMARADTYSSVGGSA